MPVLIALSFTHLLNDMIQSLIPAIYPIIKTAYALDFGQIGLITLTFQVSASLLQPAVGSTPTSARCPIRWSPAWASAWWA
jgi:FSR family fosmidomycin resistance protein-like MFS transporter